MSGLVGFASHPLGVNDPYVGFAAAPSSGPPGSPLAWYDPSDISSLTVAGGLCSQMNDKSGNGHHVTASGTARPQSGLDTINGLNALTFAATTTTMVSGAIVQAQPYTVFIVCQLKTAGGTNNQLLDSIPSRPTIGQNSGSDWFYYGGSSVVLSSTALDLNAHEVDAIFNGASSSLQLDGATIATGNPGANSLNVIGINNPSTGWPGKTAEIIFYATALGSTLRLSVQSYLKSKWGTP